ncbi:MAG: histidine phosphatase family protein [Pseudomonadota bacterium]
MLSLLRHAKSDWGENVRRDFDRPLNARGRAASERMAKFFAANEFDPDLVLVSPARRTMETLDIISRTCPWARAAVPDDALYMITLDELLGKVRDLPNMHDHVLIVGHNPGLEQLAAEIAAPNSISHDDAAMARLRSRFATGALAEFDCHIDKWKDMAPRTASLRRFTKPKDLRSGRG